MAIGKSIRIYDLAREVKQDTKRVMEDLRREGIDVSVASNTVPFEVAEKVRSKYFPKTEAAPKRSIKVIKKAPKTDEPVAEEVEAPAVAEEPPVEAAPIAEAPAKKAAVAKPAAVPEEAPAVETTEAAPKTRQVKKLAKKPEPVETAQETPHRQSISLPSLSKKLRLRSRQFPRLNPSLKRRPSPCRSRARRSKHLH